MTQPPSYLTFSSPQFQERREVELRAKREEEERKRREEKRRQQQQQEEQKRRQEEEELFRRKQVQVPPVSWGWTMSEATWPPSPIMFPPRCGSRNCC